MRGMWDLSDWEFKTTTINRLRAPKDKVESKNKEQMGNVNTEMKIIKKDPKIKNEYAETCSTSIH